MLTDRTCFCRGSCLNILRAPLVPSLPKLVANQDMMGWQQFFTKGLPHLNKIFF